MVPESTMDHTLGELVRAVQRIENRLDAEPGPYVTRVEWEMFQASYSAFRRNSDARRVPWWQVVVVVVAVANVLWTFGLID